jgi:Tfp pilus assembly protein PilF
MAHARWTFTKQFPSLRLMLVASSVLPLIACTNTRQPISIDVALQKLKAKDYAGCIAEIDRMLATGQGNAVAYGTRAFCRSATGDGDGAIADYSSAIAFNPKNPASFNNRGAERMRKKDLDGALADFATAVSLDPRYAQAVRNLGTAYRLKGNLQEALVEYSRAIELEPSNAQGYFDRGRTRIEAGDAAGGQADLKLASRLRQSDPDRSQEPEPRTH